MYLDLCCRAEPKGSSCLLYKYIAFTCLQVSRYCLLVCSAAAAAHVPANTRHRPNVEPMLGHLRRWPNIDPTLGRCLLFHLVAGAHPALVQCRLLSNTRDAFRVLAWIVYIQYNTIQHKTNVKKHKSLPCKAKRR